jgi:hypothetical protein
MITVSNAKSYQIVGWSVPMSSLGWMTGSYKLHLSLSKSQELFGHSRGYYHAYITDSHSTPTPTYRQSSIHQNAQIFLESRRVHRESTLSRLSVETSSLPKELCISIAATITYIGTWIGGRRIRLLIWSHVHVYWWILDSVVLQSWCYVAALRAGWVRMSFAEGENHH